MWSGLQISDGLFLSIDWCSLVTVFQVIDDSDYESAEQFELHLSEPSLPAILGPLATAIVIIEGPNDGGYLFLAS